MRHRFFGTHRVKVDDKGRMQVPADFRRVLAAADDTRPEGETPVVYVMHGDTRNPWYLCHSEASMADAVARFDAVPATDPRKPALRALLYAKVERVRLDEAGRLSIPKPLRERIGVERGTAVFEAQGDTFRLYSSEIPATLADPLEALLAELPDGAELDALLPDL